MRRISHLTFILQDLECSKNFFETIFDAQTIYFSGTDAHSLAKEMFLLIDDLWIAIMEGSSLVERTYNHVAFKIEAEEIDCYLQKIKGLNIEIEKGRSRIEGEGQSIYFYDYDNHLFELHTGTLNERLEKYKREASEE